jgi:hypothetical protein
LSTRQLNRAIHFAAEVAKIDKRVSMHTLRHYVPLRTMSSSQQPSFGDFGELLNIVGSPITGS